MANFFTRLFGPWHGRGLVGGFLALARYRIRMRRKNLFGTEPELEKKGPALGKKDPRRKARSADGTYNDLETPGMGRAGARFGRNVPLDRAFPDTNNLLNPSPREISRKLMKRDRFIPAEHINLLVPAWIQFQVHDWFSHGANERENQFDIPLSGDDDWPRGRDWAQRAQNRRRNGHDQLVLLIRNQSPRGTRLAQLPGGAAQASAP